MRSTVLLSLLAIASLAQLKAGIVVTVSPAIETAALGSAASVNIEISGLGSQAAPSLGAYDLNIGFDPSLLSFNGVTFGDPGLGDQLNLSGAGTVSDFSLSPGLLEFFEISLDPAAVLDTQQPGQFVLAALSFNATGVGSSSLPLTVNSIGDANGAALDVALQGGSIQVVATPEPGTFRLLLCLLLLSGGSLGMAAIGRRSPWARRSSSLSKYISET